MLDMRPGKIKTRYYKKASWQSLTLTSAVDIVVSSAHFSE